MGTRHRDTKRDFPHEDEPQLLTPMILREAQGDKEGIDPILLGYIAAREAAIDEVAANAHDPEAKERYAVAVDAVETRKQEIQLGDPPAYPIGKIK